ncbi:MAG TPA: TadA family conjugal transfer-associated ATPase, partial [Frankiaceae bacterium]|nr:TadA family conjugal transfer-associated ATPase [Frankiaceae bacterium]
MAPDPALVERVRRRLAGEAWPPSSARIAAAVRAEGGFGAADALPLLERLEDEVAGAGPLGPLLRDPSVTDVLVNAPDEVWVDRGSGLERAPVSFASDADVVALVRRLAARVGRRLDAAQPWVDARLPDGTRLHAVLSPPATRATCVSIRTLRRQHLGLADLRGSGALDGTLASWLAAIVAARLAVVVSGGTGTGKTTLLGCLLGLVAPAERVVIVEDAAELRPSAPHVVSLEARPPNVEGAGAVTLRDLVRQAMRMRPDRLVVGEVRGGEVVDMLAALNTGHDGGMTTLHANAAADVLPRLAALAGPAGLTGDALHAQVAAALDVCVHLARDGARRRVADVSVVGHGTALTYDGTATSPGPALAALAGILTARGTPPP